MLHQITRVIERTQFECQINVNTNQNNLPLYELLTNKFRRIINK